MILALLKHNARACKKLISSHLRQNRVLRISLLDFFMLVWALCSSEKHLIIAAGEILSVLLDHSTLNVRHHVVVQAVALGQSISHTNIGGTEQTKFVDVTNGRPPFKETLMQILCRLMANSQDLALQNQLADALRLICDTPPLEGLADQVRLKLMIFFVLYT